AQRPELREKIEVHLLGRITPGAYGDRLREEASRCGAVLHGFFPEEEKAELGNRYDLAVFPTQAFETYSIVVDEALAMGMPVVATSPGAQSERVGHAGRVVPAGDVDALAKAIGEFLNPKVREKAALAAAGTRVGTMDKHWMMLNEVYQDLVYQGSGLRCRSCFHIPFVERQSMRGAARPLFTPPHFPHIRNPAH
ncbi:MAG: glycosyltransferase, partial [Planctomycetota bacterium]